ncbi:hypothetical protein [Pseudogemmobacter bohemicus]|uniref:hypothetical protein n=1 Tax=Pseudogemmobacter bohemicus TaxID=2250708 RepID=UPI000DD414C6|nr:hypothetical protein [Pseudogemmobacter bohemicus]
MRRAIAFDLQDSTAVAAALFAMNAGVRPEMGPRDHAAWVMNVLAHVLGPWIAARDCSGAGLPPDTGMRLLARVAEGGCLTFDLPGEPPGAARLAMLPPEAAAGAVARLFAPAVGAFAFTGNLAPSALWRIVGDGLAWGWVEAGAHQRGQAVLTTPGAPFANRQLRLERGAVRRRGGCCRWLSVNGETCANCPLRKTPNKTGG